MSRQGDKETRRQGDKETRRQGLCRFLLVSLSPCLLVCLSLVGLNNHLRAEDPRVATLGPPSPATDNLSLTTVPPAEEQVVDLATALQLAEAQNPNIGLARQAIQEALALQMQARSMMLPTVRAGANYHGHQGILQTGAGQMRPVTESSLYFGNGAMALGSTTAMIPGIQIFTHLGDGVFEPLAARQFVASRRFQSEAATNQVLLDVAGRFLELVRAEAELQAIRLSEEDVGQAVLETKAFAEVRQGRHADYMRAQATADLLHADEVQAQENLLTASAELVRVLSLAPSIRLRVAAQPKLELVDAQRSLEELIQLAQNSRPELAALAAEIARKQIQVRQERARPFLPTISLGISNGDFGGGTNRTDLVPVHPEFGRFAGRTDVHLLAYWTLDNLGAGNLAKQKQRIAEKNLAVLEQDRMVNAIRREVAAARAGVLARQQDLQIARRRLQIAQRAFQADLARIKNLQGLPIELLNSLNRLTQARRDISRQEREYNLAQMQLFVALGNNPMGAPGR